MLSRIFCHAIFTVYFCTFNRAKSTSTNFRISKADTVVCKDFKGYRTDFYLNKNSFEESKHNYEKN